MVFGGEKEKIGTGKERTGKIRIIIIL